MSALASVGRDRELSPIDVLVLMEQAVREQDISALTSMVGLQGRLEVPADTLGRVLCSASKRNNTQAVALLLGMPPAKQPPLKRLQQAQAVARQKGHSELAAELQVLVQRSVSLAAADAAQA